MSDNGNWEAATGADVQVGDRVRLEGGDEFDVARIEDTFLGIPNLRCLIEDTPERWHAYPVMGAVALQLRR